MKKGDRVEVRFLADPGKQIVGIQLGWISHIGVTRIEVEIPALSGAITLSVERSWLMPNGPDQWILEQLSVKVP
ncbi:hypothetical protein [Methylorubrum sp. GM97]|uniref:hypothetical protein n=1 Tax=Methylorubrum sp. GM97 TaxID=2938232 RepID=UPI0021C28107|nr:hypothetical protein [Methylorubrum sp. GM97]